jgi:hypothetical protein
MTAGRSRLSRVRSLGAEASRSRAGLATGNRRGWPRFYRQTGRIELVRRSERDGHAVALRGRLTERNLALAGEPDVGPPAEEQALRSRRAVEDDDQLAFPRLRLLAEPHRPDAATGRALGQAPDPGQRSKELRGLGELDIGAAQGDAGGSERAAEDHDAPASIPDGGERNGARV